ncbi:hypothetical protein AYI68_g6269 [Smittium mucronatum]|uniref:C17orf113 probable zinc finger domain-containing protein n=1 Tax=Smittium mucronatum TaxID=133383 RepID=A0A1R0GRX9_9FUNG|nr:hypothetical protein AYI68_g6269 [Smittium mucronatum]
MLENSSTPDSHSRDVSPDISQLDTSLPKSNLETLRKVKKKPNRHFKSRWLIKFPWLFYDSSLNVLKCSLCVNNHKNNQFATDGSKNFKTSAFVDHENSKEHRSSINYDPLNKILKSRTVSQDNPHTLKDIHTSINVISKPPEENAESFPQMNDSHKENSKIDLELLNNIIIKNEKSECLNQSGGVTLFFAPIRKRYITTFNQRRHRS